METTITEEKVIFGKTMNRMLHTLNLIQSDEKREREGGRGTGTGSIRRGGERRESKRGGGKGGREKGGGVREHARVHVPAALCCHTQPTVTRKHI